MNIKNRYLMRRKMMRLVLQIFSAKAATVVYLGLLITQYESFGMLEGTGRWVPNPGSFNHLSFAIHYVLLAHVFWIIGAILFDAFTWPILFRDELK